MIFLSIGLPGRVAEWCDAITVRVAEHLGGTVAFKAWPTLDDMLGYRTISSAMEEAALTLIKCGATHLLMAARQPDERLRLALVETGARFIVALDDPRVAVAEILEETNAKLSAVTRVVANSCPLVMRYLSMPGALTIHAERATADPCGTAQAIARHFGLSVNSLQIDEIVDDLAQAGLGPVPTARNAWSLRIPEAGHKMVDGALAGYAEFFARGSLGQIVWARDLFAVFGVVDQSPTAILDLSGGARYLTYGPYIQVPPGRWTARVVLGVSPDAAGNTFVVDAFADTRQLGHTVLTPAEGGVHAADIEFSMEDASATGLEVRIYVTNENARGQLAFGHVVLQPLSTRQLDAISGSEAFESVLEL